MNHPPAAPRANAAECHVGPFPLKLDANDAAVLADALGSQRPGWVPMIYPIRWMALPEIQTAIATMVDLGRVLLLHETQSFEATVPLRADTGYLLSALIQVTGNDPQRLTVLGTASDLDGAICARFQASLRLLPYGAVSVMSGS